MPGAADLPPFSLPLSVSCGGPSCSLPPAGEGWAGRGVVTGTRGRRTSRPAVRPRSLAVSGLRRELFARGGGQGHALRGEGVRPEPPCGGSVGGLPGRLAPRLLTAGGGPFGTG